MLNRSRYHLDRAQGHTSILARSGIFHIFDPMSVPETIPFVPRILDAARVFADHPVDAISASEAWLRRGEYHVKKHLEALEAAAMREKAGQEAHVLGQLRAEEVAWEAREDVTAIWDGVGPRPILCRWCVHVHCRSLHAAGCHSNAVHAVVVDSPMMQSTWPVSPMFETASRTSPLVSHPLTETVHAGQEGSWSQVDGGHPTPILASPLISAPRVSTTHRHCSDPSSARGRRCRALAHREQSSRANFPSDRSCVSLCLIALTRQAMECSTRRRSPTARRRSQTAS